MKPAASYLLTKITRSNTETVNASLACLGKLQGMDA